MRKLLPTLLMGAAAALISAGANAALLLSTSFSGNFPFGPFLPNEAIEIKVALTNTSASQTVTVCEGVCLGDEFTYSLGGLASIPNGYSFHFGDDPTEAVFDGQIAGTLLPGQSKQFIFGVYSPVGQAAEGMYAFSTQLQIFDATPERQMLAAPTFSGNWSVECSEFPGGGGTGGCFPGPGPFPAPEPSTLALLMAALLAVTTVLRLRSRVAGRSGFE